MRATSEPARPNPMSIALSKAVRAAAPQVPIIWGGAFPTNCPDAALNSSTSTTPCAARARRPSRSCSMRLSGGASEASATSRSELALQRPDRAQQGARLFRPRAWSGAALRAPRQPAAVPDAHLSRPAHRRLPGGTRLPLPLHVLRRRGHVPRQDGAADGRAPRGGPAASSRRGSAWTRSSSTTTTSSIARSTWCRCWRCWRSFELPWWCFARSDALLNLSERSWELVQKEPAAHGLHRRRVSERLAAARHPQGHAPRSDAGGGRDVPQPRRRPGAVLHAGAAAGPGGGDRADLRVHPHDQARSPADRDHALHLHAAAAARHGTNARARSARHAELRDCAGQAGEFPDHRRRVGAAASGSTTGATRTAPWLSARLRRAHPSISPPCWAAAFRPSWTSARPPGASPRCARWPRGATASATTIVRGNWTCRRSSSAADPTDAAAALRRQRGAAEVRASGGDARDPRPIRSASGGGWPIERARALLGGGSTSKARDAGPAALVERRMRGLPAQRLARRAPRFTVRLVLGQAPRRPATRPSRLR